MASWYSNLLTKTSSQISNLRSTLLSSEADGDTDDDTHVCRVLRNYYSEKGRPFPPWLPPDPKAPAQPAIQPLYAQAGGHQGGRLAAPGLQQQQPQQQLGGGLSSLWDNNAGQQQQPAVPASLRAGGGRGMMQRPGGGMDDRPGAGQRAGASYQGSLRETSSSGGASAQDRLRQRLRGARTTSPNQGGQTPFQPPPSSSSSSGAGGGGNYEDRFAPGGSYDTGRGGSGTGGDNPYGGGRRPGLPSGPRGYR